MKKSKTESSGIRFPGEIYMGSSTNHLDHFRYLPIPGIGKPSGRQEIAPQKIRHMAGYCLQYKKETQDAQFTAQDSPFTMRF